MTAVILGRRDHIYILKEGLLVGYRSIVPVSTFVRPASAAAAIICCAKIKEYLLATQYLPRIKRY